MDNARIADSLVAGLNLDMVPVGVAFLDTPPAGVTTFDGQVPSTCSLWRRAEACVFYAPMATHGNCALGAMVMGFDLPQQTQDDLMGQVKLMTGAQYITPDEPAQVPKVPTASKGILYGPLKDLPVAPELILTWLTPEQAMLYNEAEGDIRWGSSAPLNVLGRPGCAVLPIALRESRPALTFGCAGMRTYTEIAGDRLLMALPGSEAERFVGKLKTTDEANHVMFAYYQQHKASFQS